MGSDHCPIAIRIGLPNHDSNRTALENTDKSLREIPNVVDEEVKEMISRVEEESKD